MAHSRPLDYENVNVLGLAIALSECVALVRHRSEYDGSLSRCAGVAMLTRVSAMEVTGSNLRQVSPEQG